MGSSDRHRRQHVDQILHLDAELGVSIGEGVFAWGDSVLIGVAPAAGRGAHSGGAGAAAGRLPILRRDGGVLSRRPPMKPTSPPSAAPHGRLSGGGLGRGPRGHRLLGGAGSDARRVSRIGVAFVHLVATTGCLLTARTSPTAWRLRASVAVARTTTCGGKCEESRCLNSGRTSCGKRPRLRLGGPLAVILFGRRPGKQCDSSFIFGAHLRRLQR